MAVLAENYIEVIPARVRRYAHDRDGSRLVAQVLHTAGRLDSMEEPSRRPLPADELIVRLYRRLLGFVGGIGLFFFVLQFLPPAVEARLLASLPMAAFALVCLWARQALAHPRPLTYWATVTGFGGVVASIVVTSILNGDILTTLFTAFVWAGPLRALAHPAVRRALRGDDEPRGGLRRRLRDAAARVAALLKPQLRPAPVPAA